MDKGQYFPLLLSIIALLAAFRDEIAALLRLASR